MPSFLIEEQQIYVTFKPDQFDYLTMSRIAIALEGVVGLTLDPSVC